MAKRSAFHSLVGEPAKPARGPRPRMSVAAPPLPSRDATSGRPHPVRVMTGWGAWCCCRPPVSRRRRAPSTIGRVSNSRLVYSTDDGDRRGRNAERREPLPQRRQPHTDGVVRVSREKGGRRGKTVTLVRGLPPGETQAVAGDLKRLCGAGGSVKEDAVEIQGDHRDKVAARLRAAGYDVKLAGG